MSFVIPLLNGQEPLSRQIYLWFRRAILQRVMAGGERLPSTRELAEQLHVSRTVVVLAYEQLLAEGFVEGRAGSGTYVTHGLSARRAGARAGPIKVRLSRYGRAAQAAAKANFLGKQAPRLRYDFAYGRSDVEVFPFEMWRRMLLRNARKASVRALDYGPTTGSAALREAISVHVRRSRAVICDSSQVIVVSGSQQALDLVARVLIDRGDRIAIEDPCYQGTSAVLRSADASVLPMPVDRDGLDPARIPDTNVRMVFVTPSHQFPTGAILSLPRRLALVDWARRQDGLVVEDDYDGEYRYEDQSLQSLQGLDAEGRVIYIGTFSRTVFSSLRIGYLVVPKPLIAAFTSAKWLCDRHTATLEQETLAEFITSGLYERHLRRVRRRNAARRTALREAIGKYLGDRVEVTGYGAGAHVALWPRARIVESAVIARAAALGVAVYGISPYFLTTPPRRGLMLGYSRMKESDIREGVRRLSEVL